MLKSFRPMTFVFPLSVALCLASLSVNDGRRDDTSVLDAVSNAPSVTYAPETHYTPKTLEHMLDSAVISSSMHGNIPADETLGLEIFDLDSNKVLYEYNAGLSLQSASMVKIPIALAFFDRVSKRKLDYTLKRKMFLDSMVFYSDNYCSNYFMRLMRGPHAVQKILRNNYPKIFDKLEIRDYLPVKKTDKSPYGNKATIHEYVRLLQEIYRDNLPHSQEIKRLMAGTRWNRIMTPAFPKEVYLYNKTGTTARTCGDIGIVAARDIYNIEHAYIFAYVIERNSFGTVRRRKFSEKECDAWAMNRGNVMRVISEMTYKQIGNWYSLPELNARGSSEIDTLMSYRRGPEHIHE